MAYGSCQRCGFQYDLSQIKTEWTNLRVCPPCFDHRPAHHSPIRIGPEGIANGLPPEGTGIEYGGGLFDDDIFDGAMFDMSIVDGVTEADL